MRQKTKNIALNDRSFKNFYIFNEYNKLPDAHPLKPYLKYFATNTADSTETKNIHTKVQWYQADEDTQERYMTWEQEIQLAREDAAEAAAEKERERNQKIIATKDETIAEKDGIIATKDETIEKQEREIAELKAKLAEMQK